MNFAKVDISYVVLLKSQIKQNPNMLSLKVFFKYQIATFVTRTEDSFSQFLPIKNTDIKHLIFLAIRIA